MDSDEFYIALLKIKENPEPDYGGNVLPAARIYSNINSISDYNNFEEALEKILSSKDVSVRKFGVSLCLAFLNFNDIILPPKFIRERNDAS